MTKNCPEIPGVSVWTPFKEDMLTSERIKSTVPSSPDNESKNSVTSDRTSPEKTDEEDSNQRSFRI